jgi:hypothetical protein
MRHHTVYAYACAVVYSCYDLSRPICQKLRSSLTTSCQIYVSRSNLSGEGRSAATRLSRFSTNQPSSYLFTMYHFTRHSRPGVPGSKPKTSSIEREIRRRNKEGEEIKRNTNLYLYQQRPRNLLPNNLPSTSYTYSPPLLPRLS